MSNAHGYPIWYELITTDPDAAQHFYGDVVGWTVHDSGQEGMDYRILNATDGSVGGLMRLPDDAQAGGMRPTWLGYIGVDDVDACVEAITKAGGAIHMPARDIPGVGRIAMVADPQGDLFYVMRGASNQTSHAFLTADEAAPGHVVWNELSAADPEAAIGFYADTFGWRQEGAMPMGGHGDYRFLHAGSTCLGAVMGQAPNGRDGWQFYWLVPELDTAIERLRTGYGAVVQGPDEIPGGDFSLVAEDPQGVRFGLVGPRQL